MKFTPIKWRKKDEVKLTNYIRKFNAAVTRFEKANPDYVGTTIIPSRLKKSELLTQIKTRADLNQQIKRIDRFFKKGSREVKSIDGIRVTAWEKKELQYAQRRINMRNKKRSEMMRLNPAQRRRENLEGVDIKKRVDLLKKAFKESGNIEQFTSDWKNFSYQLMRNARESKEIEDSIRYYNQYLKMARNNLNPDDSERVISLIKKYKLKGSDLFYAVSIDDILEPDFIYGPEDSQTKADYIIDSLQMIFQPPEEEEMDAETKRKAALIFTD